MMTVIAGLSGPFGTYDVYDAGQRLLLWACILGFCMVYGLLVRAYVVGELGLRAFLTGSPLIATVLALTLPSVGLAILPVVLGPDSVHIPGWWELACFVFCTSLGVGTFRCLIGEMPFLPAAAPPREPPRPAPTPTTDAPRLIRRLPADLRGRLISVSVRDHYVDVRTDKGQASLLLRLGDAVAETDGVDGAQVHRSHWVAWDKVRRVERVGGKLMLEMQDGSRVPVSRPYRPVVEARGIGTAIAE